MVTPIREWRQTLLFSAWPVCVCVFLFFAPLRDLAATYADHGPYEGPHKLLASRHVGRNQGRQRRRARSVDDPGSAFGAQVRPPECLLAPLTSAWSPCGLRVHHASTLPRAGKDGGAAAYPHLATLAGRGEESAADSVQVGDAVTPAPCLSPTGAGILAHWRQDPAASQPYQCPASVCVCVCVCVAFTCLFTGGGAVFLFSWHVESPQ